MCDKCNCTCKAEAPKKIDWTKPIQTVDGRFEARLLGEISHASHRRVVYIAHSLTKSNVDQFDENGQPWNLESWFALKNVPEKMVRPVCYLVIDNRTRHMYFVYQFGIPNLRVVADDAIPESTAKALGFKEWVDA